MTKSTRATGATINDKGKVNTTHGQDTRTSSDMDAEEPEALNDTASNDSVDNMSPRKKHLQDR